MHTLFSDAYDASVDPIDADCERHDSPRTNQGALNDAAVATVDDHQDITSNFNFAVEGEDVSHVQTIQTVNLLIEPINSNGVLSEEPLQIDWNENGKFLIHFQSFFQYSIKNIFILSDGAVGGIGPDAQKDLGLFND